MTINDEKIVELELIIRRIESRVELACPTEIFVKRDHEADVSTVQDRIISISEAVLYLPNELQETLLLHEVGHIFHKHYKKKISDDSSISDNFRELELELGSIRDQISKTKSNKVKFQLINKYSNKEAAYKAIIFRFNQIFPCWREIEADLFTLKYLKDNNLSLTRFENFLTAVQLSKNKATHPPALLRKTLMKEFAINSAITPVEFMSNNMLYSKLYLNGLYKLTI